MATVPEIRKSWMSQRKEKMVEMAKEKSWNLSKKEESQGEVREF